MASVAANNNAVMMGFAGINAAHSCTKNSHQSVDLDRAQQINGRRVLIPAIMSRLPISGRVIAEWWAANPCKPSRNVRHSNQSHTAAATS